MMGWAKEAEAGKRQSAIEETKEGRFPNRPLKFVGGL